MSYSVPTAATHEIEEIRSALDDLGPNLTALTGNLNEFFETYLLDALEDRGYTTPEAEQLIAHRTNPKIAVQISAALR